MAKKRELESWRDEVHRLDAQMQDFARRLLEITELVGAISDKVDESLKAWEEPDLTEEEGRDAL